MIGKLRLVGMLLTVGACCLSFAGCETAANANYLTKAEAVVALHSSAIATVPEFIIPDNSSTEVHDNSLTAETGSRLPGDYESVMPMDNTLCFLSLAPAAAVESQLQAKLDALPSLPKEELAAKPSVEDLQVQCNGPMCNMPASPAARGGGGYGGNPYVGSGQPARRFGWRVTHPFGGRGIPLVRRFTRR